MTSGKDPGPLAMLGPHARAGRPKAGPGAKGVANFPKRKIGQQAMAIDF